MFDDRASWAQSSKMADQCLCLNGVMTLLKL
jgi:hypothetical protein